LGLGFITDVWRHGAYKTVMRTREQLASLAARPPNERTINYSHDIALIHNCCLPCLFAMPCASSLTNLLAVHVDAVACRRSVARGKPVLWVLVVKGPRWNDDEECEGGASEADVERKLDVLLCEAY
jgi:hypothetical protein